MTISRADFLVEFAEFTGAENALVDAKLAAALLRTPESIWDDLQDEGIKYLAAHMLALSPFARELKLVQDDGQTIYGKQRAELESIVSSGFRVTGDTTS